MKKEIIENINKNYYEYIFIDINKRIICFLKNKNYPIRELIVGIYIGTILLKSMSINPKIGILSGGRINDKGRSKDIDRTIEISNSLYYIFLKYGFNVKNHMILIEDAIKESNLIIIPDLLSFNFIINTLINIANFKQLCNIKVLLKYL